MTVALVNTWLVSGALDLPLPGGGDTAQRWNRLAALAETDVVCGRLAEAHVDAVAILAELDGPAPTPGQFWGVWAAEARDAVLSARDEGGRVLLDGTKVWCSGAGLCSHALVTARLPSGDRGLFAVDLDAPTVCAPCRAAGATREWPNPIRALCNSPRHPLSRSGRRGSI